MRITHTAWKGKLHIMTLIHTVVLVHGSPQLTSYTGLFAAIILDTVPPTPYLIHGSL